MFEQLPTCVAGRDSSLKHRISSVTASAHTWNSFVSSVTIFPRFSFFSFALNGRHRTTTWTHSCFFSAFLSFMLEERLRHGVYAT